jgi:hypothetical protein
MSPSCRFVAVVFMPVVATLSCGAGREPHSTSPALSSGNSAHTRHANTLARASARPTRDAGKPPPAPLACLPRVQVSNARGEDSWLAAPDQPLCCRFEGYASAPPRPWAGGRDCLTRLVPGLRPHVVFRPEIILPYSMRLPFDGPEAELSDEQRQALDKLVQALSGKGGSAPTVRPALPDERFPQQIARARKLAQLTLDYLRARGLTRSRIAAEDEWRVARGTTPNVTISGVENSGSSSAPECTSGMTLYAGVPASARSLVIEACHNGACSRSNAELPGAAATPTPAAPNGSAPVSARGTPNAMVFALSGAVPAGALLTLRGTVEDSAFAQQKLKHPTLIPSATPDHLALEVRLTPAEPLRDGDRYALALFVDGASTPSLKAEQSARYQPSTTHPDCKNGALTFSTNTAQPGP